MAALGPSYFSTVERYRTFFQNYNITPNVLVGRKVNPNQPLPLNGPQGNCILICETIREPIGLPEETVVDLYQVRQNGLTIGSFYVTDGGVKTSDTELPFDKMYFRVFDYVRGNTSGGGKTRHRRRKSRMSKGKKRQTRKK